jgi:hypothetical protein
MGRAAGRVLVVACTSAGAASDTRVEAPTDYSLGLGPGNAKPTAWCVLLAAGCTDQLCLLAH